MFKKTECKKLVLLIGMALITGMFLSCVVSANTQLSAYEKANVPWRQYAGQTISAAMLLQLETNLLEKQIGDFEKLTGIKVTLYKYPELELHQKVLVDLAAHAGKFDVVELDMMFIPQYATAGYLEPLDKYLNGPLGDIDWYNPSGFVQASWEAGHYNNDLYALPYTIETANTFYREDLLRQIGANPPDDLCDFWQTAKKLNQLPNIAGVGLRGLKGQGMNVVWWAMFLKAYGGTFFKNFPTDMHPNLTSPESLAATKYYADILQKFGPKGVATWGWEELLSAMQQGKVAMGINAQNEAPELEDPAKSKTAGKWGITLLPKGPICRPGYIFSFLLGMNKASQHKGPAWLFLQWATSYEAVAPRVGVTGGTVRRAVLKSPEFREKVSYMCGGKFAEVIEKAFAMGDPELRPRFKHWREMGDRIGIAIQQAIAGADVKKVMEEAQTDIEVMLKEYGYIE